MKTQTVCDSLTCHGLFWTLQGCQCLLKGCSCNLIGNMFTHTIINKWLYTPDWVKALFWLAGRTTSQTAQVDRVTAQLFLSNHFSDFCFVFVFLPYLYWEEYSVNESSEQVFFLKGFESFSTPKRTALSITKRWNNLQCHSTKASHSDN